MNFLTRNDLVQIKNMWNKNLEKNEYYEMLEKIEKKLNKYDYLDDKDYLINGRRQNCIERIDDYILSNYEIGEIMWAFWEFINDEYGGFKFADITAKTNMSIDELDRMDMNYRKKGIICLKEKEDILTMVNKIKKYIR